MFWLAALFVALIACVAIRNGVKWYEHPIPGLLVDPGGLVSNLGLPDWSNKRLGLKYPDRVAPTDFSETVSGGRARVTAWDRSVLEAQSTGYLDAIITVDRTQRSVRLPITPLQPLAWWLYGGSFIIAGILYAGAGLVALWASPNGKLARAFARFAVSAGVFQLTLFDAHTERTLTPVFFATYAVFPTSLVFLLLHLPSTVTWLRPRPWLETSAVGAAGALGLTAAAMHELGRDIAPLQVFFNLLAGAGFAVFATGFLFRYLRSRGEQQQTLRALLLSMIPPYAITSFIMVLAPASLELMVAVTPESTLKLAAPIMVSVPELTE